MRKKRESARDDDDDDDDDARPEERARARARRRTHTPPPPPRPVGKSATLAGLSARWPLEVVARDEITHRPHDRKRAVAFARPRAPSASNRADIDRLPFPLLLLLLSPPPSLPPPHFPPNSSSPRPLSRSFDSGFFYPAMVDAAASSVGRGPGRGRTLNVAWDGVGFGDADYLAAFDRALMPVARAFDPEVRERSARTRVLFFHLSHARARCVSRALFVPTTRPRGDAARHHLRRLRLVARRPARALRPHAQGLRGPHARAAHARQRPARVPSRARVRSGAPGS